MKKVITLTLSPTVDKSTAVEQLVAEQKMSCATPKFEPGGGGINISRALKRLGLNALTVFPSGGLPGQLLQELLNKEGIDQHVIKTKNWTRENFIVVNSSNNQQYRFGMPGTEIFPDEENAIFHELEKLSKSADFIVSSGSMPPGISKDFLAKVAGLAKANGAKFIVDTSGDALKLAVEEGVYLLKPNLGELSKLVGVEALDNDSVDDAAREIIGRGKCEIIVVSMGPQGAYLVTKDVAEHIPAPAVKKLSTVGAGDSMVAGMVYALSLGKTLTETVKMGIACGSAATMNPGTELFNKQDVDRLYKWLLNK